MNNMYYADSIDEMNVLLARTLGFGITLINLIIALINLRVESSLTHIIFSKD